MGYFILYIRVTILSITNNNKSKYVIIFGILSIILSINGLNKKINIVDAKPQTRAISKEIYLPIWNLWSE